MGSLLSCQRCPANNTSTILTFSEPLVLKAVEGIQPEPVATRTGLSQDLNDREWMDRLLCIDNSHSTAYGLTAENIDILISNLEKTLNELGEKDLCLEKVKQCYLDNPGETMQCSDDVKEFIDRVDTHRLKTMKDKFAGECSK